LFPYLGGIARDNQFATVEVGGVEDHVHLLLALPSTLTIAQAMQYIKGSSSRWIHLTFPELLDFGWQNGYGAFSIGQNQVERTVHYIRNQEEHHRQQTFQDEFLQFLRTHGLELDARYIWS
jgi:REP element-mobilizing transposase RayT